MKISLNKNTIINSAGIEAFVNLDTLYYGSNQIIGIENEEYQPERLALYQNHPNPFSSTTVISYMLPVAANVELSVYDLTVRRVATLINEHQQSGKHEYEWNAGGIKPGIYMPTENRAKREGYENDSVLN